MWTEPADLVLAANSARAIAESAVRGGFRVRVLDGFCDQDTRALGPCTRVPMVGWGLDPVQLSAALERLCATGSSPVGLVYGAGLESSSDLLSALPGRVRLLGNAPRFSPSWPIRSDSSPCCSDWRYHTRRPDWTRPRWGMRRPGC